MLNDFYECCEKIIPYNFTSLSNHFVFEHGFSNSRAIDESKIILTKRNQEERITAMNRALGKI